MLSMVRYPLFVAEGSHGASKEDDLYVALGRRIARLRKSRGLTQSGLAGLLGLTRASVANIERGRQKFLVHTALRLVSVLKVTPNELLGRLDVSPDAPLDSLLDDRPSVVRDWIRSAVTPRRRPEGMRHGRSAKAHS